MSNHRVRYGKCKCCGETFVKSYPTVKYCSDDCRKFNREVQSRNKSLRWYHRNKHRLTDKQRYGLGSGYLGCHRNTDFSCEAKSVKNELKRLKLKN